MVTVLLACRSTGVRAEPADLVQLDAITKQFPFAIQTGTPGGSDHRFIYADYQTHVHVMKVKNGRLEHEWETTNLGSRVTSMFVTDLYADGKQKLAVSTAGGRIVFYELSDFSLAWGESAGSLRSRALHGGEPTSTTIAQQELVFIADKILSIYDSLNKNFEWQSTSEFDAQQIVVANVDDDDQPEIILNTGVIVDSRFYNIEFQADNVFGNRISLLDINGDGVPEIFGELLDFNLKVFDIYAEREIW